MALGIPQTGSAGLIYAMSILSDDQSKLSAGIMCVISATFWIAAGIWSLCLYKVVHRYYRHQGLTTEEAQNEAIKGVAKSNAFNIFVRSAAMA
ncbi:hypothetical protein HK100_000242 [Physocladia obscura]|uniref:Uncharacterized protein n=1 Tax=Physocladia obscura TaxID=109957 RepID=A0AAD5T0G6_9FUNG|nr:hypothetical protein HK100_000242 [Physocladia obscura]